MRALLLLWVGMAMGSAFAGTVTFSGKTADAIEAVGAWGLEAVAWQPYDATADTWTKCGFMATGSVWKDKTLFAPDVNIQTAGRWRATFRAAEAAMLHQVTLSVRIHNSSGETQTQGTLRSATFRLATATAEASATVTLTGAGTLEAQQNTVTLVFDTAVTVAAGESITLMCERAEETLGCYFGLTQVAFEDCLVVSGEVAWPEDGSSPMVCFQGGTLTISAGATVNGLRVMEDSAGGTLRVFGALHGVDSGEPARTAFPLPAEVTVILEDGAELFMDGRLSARVCVPGAAMLGAASEEGTLTLDAVEFGSEAQPQVMRGCVEVYRCRMFGVAEGAALRRWDCVGQRMRIR